MKKESPIQLTENQPEPTQLYHLAAIGELQPTDVSEPELPEEVGGMPAFYYWKDAIAVGSYVHPARQFSLTITRHRLDGYVANFNRMQTNGIGIPILMDHAPTAAATLGWIVSVKRDGDRLMELHQFLGESARDIGLRNKVSLGIEPNFIDGKGIAYGEAIVHSAVTPVPVVPAQGEFEPVNLSDDSDSDILTLSLAAPEEINRVRSYLNPAAEEINRVGSYLFPSADGTIQLAEQAVKQVVAMKRDIALARGVIDPAVAEELFNLLVTPRDGVANTLLLSRSAGEPSIAIAVFDALSRNRPAPLGEVTSFQVLNRAAPGDDGSIGDLRERMIALASGVAG